MHIITVHASIIILLHAVVMSSTGHKSRPKKLMVNLGDFVREEISASPARNIPHNHSSSGPIKSAPSNRRVPVKVPIASFGDADSPTDSKYSSSLIAPVMNESEVFLSTSAGSAASSSSTMQRRKQAAGGALGQYSNESSQYGATNQAQLQEQSHQRIGSGSDEDEDYVKIQERNITKRYEHATTYVFEMESIADN